VRFFASDDQLGLCRLFKLYVPSRQSLDATAGQISAGEISLDGYSVSSVAPRKFAREQDGKLLPVDLWVVR
jgi:hypothetical protein